MKIALSVYNIETLKNSVNYIDSAILNVPYLSQIYEDSFNLDEAIELCESNNIEIVISLNRIVMEDELDKFKSFIEQYKAYNFLVADLGLVKVLKDLNLINKTIFDSSTMICNSLDAINYYNLGFKAVSMSSEIPIVDVIHSYNTYKPKLFYQVFGRKQMFYSKRRLLSLYENHSGTSYERNDLYIKEEKRDQLMPIIENKNGFFVFRSYYISMLKEIKQLSFLEYAYIESLWLKNPQITEILKIYTSVLQEKLTYEDGINQIANLGINVEDGFAYSDSIHIKEKIINE